MKIKSSYQLGRYNCEDPKRPLLGKLIKQFTKALESQDWIVMDLISLEFVFGEIQNITGVGSSNVFSNLIREDFEMAIILSSPCQIIFPAYLDSLEPEPLGLCTFQCYHGSLSYKGEACPAVLSTAWKLYPWEPNNQDGDWPDFEISEYSKSSEHSIAAVRMLIADANKMHVNIHNNGILMLRTLGAADSWGSSNIHGNIQRLEK